MEMTLEQQRALAIATARARAAEGEAAPPPDKYQQAAVEERDALNAKGVDTGSGYMRRAVQGVMPFTDEALAGLTTPLEMIKRGTLDPREGYKYAKAREDLILDDSRKKTGLLGSAIEIGGTAGLGLGLAGAGLTFARALAPRAGLAARSLASAGDAAAFGAVAGLGEGNSLEERGKHAAQGAGIGTVVGGLTPGALKLASAVASPLISNISARANPERYARTQMARALSETGSTPQQITDDVVNAAAEGQGMYTVGDAMGNAGQRMLSTAARGPGPGRTELIEFLNNRQAGQGRRVANALSEGFNAPVTAQQARTAILGARDDAADVAYTAVRRDAQPVDTARAVSHIDDTLSPYGVPQAVDAHDTVAAALAKYRARLTDGVQNNNSFNSVQRVRQDLSDEIQQAMQSGARNKARELGGLLREIDTAMESASTGFRQANREFAATTRAAEAVDEGSQAAMRGRTEDIIPRFQGMTAPEQVGYRVGYADPLIAQTQGAAFGVNKARPLMNDAFADEAAAIAPGNQLMQRRLGRENTMFSTRNAAVGNSKTAENLADDAAMGVDPTLISNLIAGNWGGVARSGLQAGQNFLSGNTPAVRNEIQRLLTMRGGNVSAQDMRQIMQEAVDAVQRRQMIASLLGRGASAGLAVTPAASGKR